MQGYREDLAYIHDVGHSGYVTSAVPGLLALLRRRGIRRGLVVDLGCGSGQWARELNGAGYDVFGVDQSRAMIRIARAKAPESTFRCVSFLRLALPECAAVTAIGECLNYCFDERAGKRALVGLFARVYRALRPGGVFVFDVAGPERAPGANPQLTWSAGPDWAVLVRTTARGDMLRRQITSFRKVGRLYRRREETHTLRLLSAAEVMDGLAACGFAVRTLQGYGRFRLLPGITAYLAVKPAARAGESPSGETASRAGTAAARRKRR